ncbi:ATP-binding protein [Syntrophomonas palmitatica]|uniref:ATP-binding protein n=1 Tax=Syntrophomonas palmitatica TaxID=402877 RepID=UPI0006D09F6B|nr:ATP-binding protein [Syntrophomonas palmitatica]
MYIARSLEKTVQDIQGSFPVLLITGPRQVGKTTLLKKMTKAERRYLSLDDPILRELAVSDPALFLQRFEPPLIIDEIQYAPQLLPHIKIYVDEHRQNGAFWLTGSQTFHLMKNASESLAGRVGILNLPGLSNNELKDKPSTPFIPKSKALIERIKGAEPEKLNDLFAKIFKGSMPALYAGKVNSDIFFSSYVQTYLQRDVRDLTQVGDELSFLRFLTCAAARTGQMVNYADMAKDTGISPPTAKQWLSILVSSGLVYLLEPYYNNALKRIIKAPKLYFLDTGLAAYLTKWTTPEALEAGAMSGAFFETWVMGEIIKSYYNAGKRPPLYYYRDKDHREIDLIIHENDTVYPIEIKKSSNPGKDAIRHFGALARIGLNIGEGGVICLCGELLPIDKQNWYIPAWMI